MSNSLKISSFQVGPENSSQDGKISRQFSVKQSSDDTKFKFSKCVLSCCRSCSFCLFPRATTKERYKSLYSKDRNKRCQRCFLCKSMSFCPTCSKCPQCCPKFGCRGQVTEVLARLAHTGCESKGGLNFERGIHATLQNQTTPDQVPCDQEWLCSPGEKQGLVPSIDRTHKQVGGRKGGDKVLSGLLQPPFSGTKIQPQMEAYLGPQPSKPILETRHLQDGNSGNNKVVSPKRGMGNVAGLQRCLFSHPHQSAVSEVPQVFSRKEGFNLRPFLSVSPQLLWNLPR